MKIITQPASDPVTLAEAKEQSRYTEADQDALFTRLIRAATADCENAIQRTLINTTYEIALDVWPDDAIHLVLPPTVSVDSIKYDDVDGAEQTLAPSEYRVDTHHDPSCITRAYNVTWPPLRAHSNAIRVRFTCGYGAAASAVPEPLRAWILIRVAQLFEHREQVAAGVSIAPIPFVDGLLDTYRILTV